MNNQITLEMMPALDGVIPAVLASASADGTPNVTYISQVFYVDDRHVALSRQFFNKTVRNVAENPFVQVMLTCPITYAIYKLQLKFEDSQTSGTIFEQMTLQLEVIASVQGKTGTFHLQAADIYQVVSIDRIYPLPV